MVRDPLRNRELARLNYHRKPHEYKNRQLINRYGISLDDYNKMLEEQNKRCKICDITQEENVSKRHLAVDHCHKTGKVRGLLCSRCNLAVEFLENNPGWADKAIVYLNKHGDNNDKDYTIGTNWSVTH